MGRSPTVLTGSPDELSVAGNFPRQSSEAVRRPKIDWLPGRRDPCRRDPDARIAPRQSSQPSSVILPDITRTTALASLTSIAGATASGTVVIALDSVAIGTVPCPRRRLARMS
jgi:hypothetical protein